MRAARGSASFSEWALDIVAYYYHNTPHRKDEAMFENPVAKRTAIAAGIGALVAIPVPFVGPLFGAVVGAGYGYFTANRRGWR